MATGHTPIVITADDFGMSEEVNSGIVAALEGGWATDASLMANMPAFAEAVDLAGTIGATDRLGVHLNLTEGPALSAELRDCPRFCTPEGELRWSHRSVWTLSAQERRAIAAEWRAQLGAVVAAGVRPSHIDSHHHVHTAWALATVALHLAREFEVPMVRPTRNTGPRPSAPVQAYKQLYNARLQRAGVTGVRYFGSAEDVREVVGGQPRPVEVMTHPRRNADGTIVDHPGGALADAVSPVTPHGRLMSHRELATRVR